MVRFDYMTKYRLKNWWYKTQLHKVIHVYFATIIQMIYLAFKYKFDFSKIQLHISMLNQNTKYEFDKESQKQRELIKELKERRLRNEEIQLERNDNTR